MPGGFGEDAFGDEPLFVVFHRVFGGPLFHQALGYVLGAAGFFVAAHPERESLYEHGARVLTQVLGQFFHQRIHLQHVVAVHLHGFHTVGRAFIHEGFETKLLVAGRAQAVAVVLNHENDRQLPHGGHVQGLVEVAFAGPAVATVGQRHLGVFIEHIGQGNTAGHGQLRP